MAKEDLTNHVVLGLTPVVSAGVASWLGFISDFNLPFLGVPVTVLTMAAAGSLLSFTYGKAEASRKKLLLLALANTFIGVAAVTVIPAAFELKWVSQTILAPVAFLTSLFARWVVPLFVDVIPHLVRKWFNLPPKKENGD